MDRKMPQLVMQLSLKNLDQEIIVPNGYEFINLGSDVAETWVRIINNTFDYGFTLTDFNKEMGNIPNEDPKFFLFVKAPDGKIVGTGAVHADKENSIVTLHYIAIENEHRGHSLGFLLSKQLLLNSKNQGFKYAELQTDDYRVPAIKTYLKLGFRPLLIHSNQAERWAELVDQVGGWDF